MKILIVIQNDKPLIFAATKLSLLQAKRDQFPADAVWRLHDGTGWAAGSNGAWRQITTLPFPLRAEILMD